MEGFGSRNFVFVGLWFSNEFFFFFKVETNNNLKSNEPPPIRWYDTKWCKMKPKRENLKFTKLNKKSFMFAKIVCNYLLYILCAGRLCYFFSVNRKLNITHLSKFIFMRTNYDVKFTSQSNISAGSNFKHLIDSIIERLLGRVEYVPT